MKRINFKMILGLFALIGIVALAYNGVLVGDLEVMTAGALPLWLTMKGTTETFVELTDAQLKELSVDDLNKYIIAKNENHIDTLVKQLEKSSEDKKIELKAEIDALKIKNLTPLTKTMNLLSAEIAELKNKGISGIQFENALKTTWDNAVAGIDLDNFGTENKTIKLDVEKAVSYGDIAGGLSLTPTSTNVAELPVRKPIFAGLFKTLNIPTDVYHYLEQATVVRDAQNVANCAPKTTKLTKETLVRNSIQPVMIKDIITFCLTYISDYPFMESRINFLLNESLMLKFDQQLLGGTGLLNEVSGIDFNSSLFSAVNPIFNAQNSIKLPTIADLVGVMATQIELLGQDNSYVPNTVAMNKGDFFTLTTAKDTQGRSLIDEVITYVNNVPYIRDMKVITSTLVLPNTLYVFDSTRATIINRKSVEVSISTQNGTNWENEFAEIKGIMRANLLVKNNDKNAFMKTTNITTALVSITAP